MNTFSFMDIPLVARATANAKRAVIRGWPVSGDRAAQTLIILGQRAIPENIPG
jgi:hypothetical protein